MSAAETEVATETSSDLSLREQLMAARDEIESREPEVEEKPQRERNERGQFLSKDEPVVQEERAAPIEAAEPPSRNEAQVEESAPVAAPQSWSYQAKSKWNDLPAEIRSEIAKREADIHKGFTKMDEDRSFAREMKQVIAPYEAMIRSEGATPARAVQSLINTAYVLRTADPVTKARAIAQVCQTYGVDLSLLANSPQQSSDPNTAAVLQRVAQLEGLLTQQQQQAQQAQEQTVLSAIESFAQDPAHPHFENVRVHMGALMQAREAKDMNEAYEMAVWARPDLRASLLAAQTAQRSQAGVTKVNKARAKGSSVRGGPGGYQPPSANPKASVREDLEAAFAEARGRV